MKFEPKSESEIASDSLLAAGVYPFEVMVATDEISKAGNEMIKLKLCVYADDGDTAHIYDYLMEKVAYKLRHFADAAGMLISYDHGELTAAQCAGKSGYCKIVIDNKDPSYLPKNVVKDYVANRENGSSKQERPGKPSQQPRPQSSQDARNKASMAAQAPVAPGGFDDDIPFN